MGNSYWWNLLVPNSKRTTGMLDIKSTVSLAELDQESRGDDLFLLAAIHAHLHSKGTIIKGFTMEGIRGNIFRGGWQIVEIGNMEEIEITPKKIAEYFKEMYGNWGIQIIPILGGYARKAYLLLDPQYPGFTNDVLTLLLGNGIASTPHPRPFELDFNAFLSASKISINLDTMKVEKIYSTNARHWNEMSIIASLVTLSLSGIDISNLYEYFCKYSDSDIIKACNNKNPQERTRFDKNFLIKNLRDLVMEAIASPLGYENDAFIKNLNVRILNLNTQNQRLLWDSLYDGLIYLAQLFDRKGKLAESIQIAQSAFIFLQYSADITVGVEERMCRKDLDQGLLSWNEITFEQLDSPSLFFQYQCCVNSLTLAEVFHFNKSVELVKGAVKSNFLWTAIEEAIKRQRKVVLLCHQVLENSLIPPSLHESFSTLFKNVVSTYLKILRRHFEAVTFCAENHIKTFYFECWANAGGEMPEFIMRQETKIAIELFEVHSKEGMSAKTRNILQKLVALLGS
jgi:hypothetical protein